SVLFFCFFFQAEDGIRDSYGDWSSDVCSSDLFLSNRSRQATLLDLPPSSSCAGIPTPCSPAAPMPSCLAVPTTTSSSTPSNAWRSEERRVGKERRSRWWA